MKTSQSVPSSIEKKPKRDFSKISLLVGTFALFGCTSVNGTKAQYPQIPVVTIPNVPRSSKSEPLIAEPVLNSEDTKHTTTTMTLLRTLNVFHAYVTPDSESHDLENPDITFSYRTGIQNWKIISGCEKVSVCDVSQVLSLKSNTITIRADFFPEVSSSYLPSFAVFPVY